MQPTTIATINPIQAPAAAVWDLLRTGENVDTWLAPITACRVEGDRRYCEAGEGKLDETILESNDETMTFRYRIDEQNAFPVTGISGVMRVETTGPESSDLYWDVEFTPTEGLPVEEFKQGIVGMYAGAAASLQELATAAA